MQNDRMFQKLETKAAGGWVNSTKVNVVPNDAIENG